MITRREPTVNYIRRLPLCIQSSRIFYCVRSSIVPRGLENTFARWILRFIAWRKIKSPPLEGGRKGQQRRISTDFRVKYFPRVSMLFADYRVALQVETLGILRLFWEFHVRENCYAKNKFSSAENFSPFFPSYESFNCYTFTTDVTYVCIILDFENKNINLNINIVQKY